MKINYRPEIDGLRAIAVLFVVLYHAKFIFLENLYFNGGYIGVDIFFVISGYLIASIIFKEQLLKKSFSFSNFYKRRIRRILPALVFISLITIPFGLIFIIPNDFVKFSNSLFFSSLFGSNIYFSLSYLVYEAENSMNWPLLHTWSLSVEEQFYILFPVALILFFKYLKKYLLHLIVLFLILSLLLATWASIYYSLFNFYLLPTRGWELLAGVLLAYFEKFNFNLNKIKFNNYFPKVGIFLIFFSFYFFNDKTLHPSLITLVPVLGCFLIIAFSERNEIVTKILSHKIFVSIGLISYSLYLWHYPLFSFAEIIEVGESKNFTKVFLILLSFILSILSYRFIELPARNNKNSFKKLSIVLMFSTLIIFFVSYSSFKTEGFKNRVPPIFLNYDNSEKLSNLIKKYNCKSITDCNFQNKKENRNLILIGDSHMRSLAFDLFDKTQKDYNFIMSVRNGCQFILNVNRVQKEGPLALKYCTSKAQKERFDFIKDFPNSTIIIGGRLPEWLSEQKFDNLEGGVEGEMLDFIQNDSRSLLTIEERNKLIIENYRLTINELLKLNNKVVLIYPIPEVGWHVPRKLYSKFPKNIFGINKYYEEQFDKDKYVTTSFETFKNRTKSSFTLLNSMKDKNLIRIYPHKLFCDNLIKDRCITHDSKKLFYLDYDHLSSAGSNLIVNEILKSLK